MPVLRGRMRLPLQQEAVQFLKDDGGGDGVAGRVFFGLVEDAHPPGFELCQVFQKGRVGVQAAAGADAGDGDDRRMESQVFAEQPDCQRCAIPDRPGVDSAG